MSYVNEKGGFHKKVTILQNDSNESTTVLRHAFLKKVENYSLQIEDFYLNKMPKININEDDAEFDIEILQFDGYDGDWEIDATFRQFKARNVYSVIEYIRQLQEFFHRFSNLVLTLGYRTLAIGGDPTTGGDTKYMPAFPGSIVNRIYGVPRPIVEPILENGSATIRQQNVNFAKSYLWYDAVNDDHMFRGFGTPEVVDLTNVGEIPYKGGHIITASLNTAKKIEIRFSSGFAYNFYL